MKIFNQGQWGSGDSNPDALRHQILNLARLPIPALPQNEDNMILNHARLPVPTLPQEQKSYKMLAKKQLPGNAHTFTRTFAPNPQRAGMDIVNK